MVSDHSNDKLIHAVCFFSYHLGKLNETELFDFLFLLDVGLFKKTGKKVTGLEYQVLNKKPVPLGGGLSWNFRPFDQYDSKNFSQQELGRMFGLVRQFKKRLVVGERTRLSQDFREGEKIEFESFLDGSPGTVTKQHAREIEQDRLFMNKLFGL